MCLIVLMFTKSGCNFYNRIVKGFVCKCSTSLYCNCLGAVPMATFCTEPHFVQSSFLHEKYILLPYFLIHTRQPILTKYCTVVILLAYYYILLLQMLCTVTMFESGCLAPCMPFYHLLWLSTFKCISSTYVLLVQLVTWVHGVVDVGALT